MNFSKETPEDEAFDEQDLQILTNCYKSREESVQSIREFCGKFAENCQKFASFVALSTKIEHFCHEFAFQSRMLLLTEEQMLQKFAQIHANSLPKRQIFAKFANNLLKINTILANKLQRAKIPEEMLDFKEILNENTLFRDNLMSILKEEAYNCAKLLAFALKSSRNKLNFATKRLKSVFCGGKARDFFENPANFRTFPEKFKKTGKKHGKNAKKCANFKFDAFFLVETVRNKHVIAAKSLKTVDKSQQFQGKTQAIYDILEVAEYRPALNCAEKCENELFSEKFQRIFDELLKMNAKIAKNIEKYHRKFMKHVKNRKVGEKSQKNVGKRASSVVKL